MAPLAHAAPITDFRLWPEYSKNAYVLFTTHCQTRDEAEMKLKVWLEILELQLRDQGFKPYDYLCRHSQLKVVEKVGKTHECRHRLNCLNYFKDDRCWCDTLPWLTDHWRVSLLLNIKQDFYRPRTMGKLAIVNLRENLATKGAYCNELTSEEYLTVREKLEHTSSEYVETTQTLRRIGLQYTEVEYEEAAAELRAIQIC